MLEIKVDSESIELCAKICHENNRAFSGTMSEYSPPWDQASDEMKKSAISGVEFVLANPKTTPAENHQAWMDYKFAAGWKLGPTKDESRKEHPCLMPYEMLSQYQRTKDVLFGATVRAFFNLF